MTDKPPPAERKAKLIEQHDRGARADKLLADPLIEETFEAIRADLIKKWEDGDGPEVREEIHGLVCAMKLFRAKFEHYIRTGDFAAKQLTELNEDKKEP